MKKYKPIPRKKAICAIPSKYVRFIGTHPAHPGTGRGPGARLREKYPKSPHEIDRKNVSVGLETEALLEHLKIQPQDHLLTEAKDILSKCGTVDGASNKTGLIIGYVQSGKTMSFTTVTTLARDNKFQLIILIAGTSISLLRQSTKRLLGDLRLLDGSNRRRDRKWQPYINPRKNDKGSIEEALAEWREPSVPQSELQTVLITVMKHHTHLAHLIEVLAQMDLSQVPALIIDDEGDQASMNNRVQHDEESTTYGRLVDLRKSLPRHTFLQYTATPQAPLLISLIDILSPQFVQILTPGEDYTGGKYFFENKALIKTIPDKDIPSLL